MKKKLSGLLVLIMIATGCGPERSHRLPILGRTEYREVNGRTDTIHHTIPDYAFVDQDNMTVTPETFKGKIYVADFFFGTCPTICPVMKQQMLRVYEAFKDDPEFGLLSHTIDPDHDTVAYLKNYAERIGVMDNRVWHFVTGDKEALYAMGSEEAYLVPVRQDIREPGGFIHSGAFILVDKERRIRGFYDGTVAAEVDQLIRDIPRLLAEYR